MIKKIYTVYDAKAEFYATPFFARNNGEALRMFQEAANDKTITIGQYPEDYALFCIGEWDELSGVINLPTEFQSLGRAIDYVKNPVVQEEIADAN